MTHSLKLNTGDSIPAVGLGYWKIPKPDAAAVTKQAIQSGYRHFDCACDYGNEAEAGQGIQAALKDGLCTRDDLWVTSKLWNTYHSADHVRQAAEKSLQDLQLDYFDLYLIHFPISTKFVPFEIRYPPEWFYDPNAAEPKMEFENIPIRETWSAMESLVTAGLAKNIGVCNFGTAMLRDLLSYAKIPPALLQVELHPLLTQEKLLRFCDSRNIAVTAFSPLGAVSYTSIGMADASESLLEHECILDCANHHKKSPAQILLRWGVQRGTAVVPKTTSPSRLVENLALFDFELTPDQMQAISKLNQNRRFNDPGDFCESAFNTFCPIFD